MELLKNCFCRQPIQSEYKSEPDEYTGETNEASDAVVDRGTQSGNRGTGSKICVKY